MLTQRAHPRISLVVGSACREVSDADLARALIAGNAWAIDETWNRFAPKIHLMARRALGVESEAEDVVQEVFHRVFRKVKTIREPDKLYNFIRAFAIHVIKSELRRRKARSWLTFHQPEALVDMVSDTLDIESRHLLRRFYGLMERLRPRDRLVFALRNFEHMTVEEIVDSTQLSMSTVKRSLVHATNKLSLWSETDPGIAELLDAKGARR
jgi:RNA polymerase sigma-70 factor (ECF subfamily)